MDSEIVGLAVDFAAPLALAACGLTVIGGLLTAWGRHVCRGRDGDRHPGAGQGQATATR